MEIRIKSILRNTDMKKVIADEKKKKVSFVDKNDEAYVFVQGTRRWNEKLKNPRKGKFDPQEKRNLVQSLSQCLR